jgi:putative SOS response-associated peptidase YedK
MVASTAEGSNHAGTIPRSCRKLAKAYAVNRAVNSVKNDTEECIEPVAD